MAQQDGPTKCCQHLHCLQALSAISTHPSLVRETLPLLLQHLGQMNKGNLPGILGKLPGQLGPLAMFASCWL